MSHIAGVKKDMIILEKSEFSALRSENEVQITVLESATLELAFLIFFFFNIMIKKSIWGWDGLAPS